MLNVYSFLRQGYGPEVQYEKPHEVVRLWYVQVPVGNVFNIYWDERGTDRVGNKKIRGEYPAL